MSIGRRKVLAGGVAVGALALAGPALARPAPPRRRRGDPEPLQYFPGLAEGFYRDRDCVYYVDERHAAWAPPGLNPARLVPVPLSAAGLPELLRQLRKRRWAWIVEHAALRRIADRPLAEALLDAAIEQAGGHPQLSVAARRLRHLRAAMHARRDLVWSAAHTDGRAFPTPIAGAAMPEFGSVF